jgi:hypothetical protein
MKTVIAVAGALVIAASCALSSFGQAVSTSPGGANADTLSDLLGMSEEQLAIIVMKMPPHGRGLNTRELALLGSRIGLSEKGMRSLRNRLGPGGTGFTVDELRMLGHALALSNEQIAAWDTYVRSPRPATAVAQQVQLPGTGTTYVMYDQAPNQQLVLRKRVIVTPTY